MGHSEDAINYDWDVLDTDTSYRIGRLTRIRDATGTTVFSYDHRGNVTTQRQKLLGTADWVWLRYAYDLGDHITRITYPSGRQVQYVRDEKGRVRSVKTRANDTVTAWTTLASNIGYEPFGPVKSVTLGNGLKAVSDWGNDGRLVTRRLYRASNGTEISNLSYAYDVDDNITGITDTLDGSKSQAFAYDAAGRLTRMDVASGAVQRADFAYDVNGNRLGEDRRAVPSDAAPLESDSYSYTAGTNQLASVATPTGTRSIAYDGRGNTSGETRPGSVSVATTYDGYGRLTGYNSSNVDALSFVYNGRDDRVAMVRGAETRRFVYDADGRVMGEYGNSAADAKAEFIWLAPQVANDNAFGGEDGVGGYAPLAVATPDLTGAIQVNWVHGGHLGVPVVITDATGNLATTPNDYLAPGFPGQSRVLADLYYNRYRDYDPTTGRYVQADPIGLAGGSNPYLYAGGNPVTGRDSSGLDYWIEGPSGSEPAGHQSFNVGDPNGAYDSQSFGVNGDPWLGGEVYEDVSKGGEIDSSHYRHTTPVEDEYIRDILRRQLGQKAGYRPWRTCRNYSQDMFTAFESMGVGRRSKSPPRRIAKQEPRREVPPISSTSAWDQQTPLDILWNIFSSSGSGSGK